MSVQRFRQRWELGQIVNLDRVRGLVVVARTEQIGEPDAYGLFHPSTGSIYSFHHVEGLKLEAVAPAAPAVALVR